MNILLTGGAGFVGINIAQRLLANGNRLVVFDCRPMLDQAQKELEQQGEFTQVCGDILNADLLQKTLREYKIDAVVHAAAITAGVQREREQYARVLQVNVLGTVAMMDAVLACGVPKMLYISSVAVYGDNAQQYEVVHEDTPPNPCNAYEISKFTAERSVLRYRELHGLDVCALRLGDVFGAWEADTGVRDFMSAPCQALRLALRGEEAVLSKAGDTGWVYVKDVAASVTALLSAKGFNHPVYNGSGGWHWSIAQWCDLLQERYPDFRWRISSREEPTLSFHAGKDNGLFDISRLMADTNYQPQYDMHRAFADYTAWAERHPELAAGRRGI